MIFWQGKMTGIMKLEMLMLYTGLPGRQIRKKAGTNP
jgi:hypothetical protein